MTETTIIILALIAVSCFLAFKFFAAFRKNLEAKAQQSYMRPITLDTVAESVSSNGYHVLGRDDKEQDISFEIDGLKYNIAIIRKPMVFINMGYGMDQDTDVDCLKEAARKVVEDMVMVKINIYENDGFMFLISAHETTYGHLTEALPKYIEIINEARQRLDIEYHEALGEKRGKTKALNEIKAENNSNTDKDQPNDDEGEKGKNAE